MAYCTKAEVESYTGFTYTNFKDAGSDFSSANWTTFVTALIANATQLIDRYCNIVSFEEHEVTEYHNGSGGSDDLKGYIDNDRIFYPRDQPVISITSVHEDTNPFGQVASWTERTERGVAAGDFALITEYETTYIYFHSNVPAKRRANVRIIYKAGYTAGSVQLNDINLAAKLIISNILANKKKIQEATTIRATGVRDYAQMFSTFKESEILTDNVKMILDRYRRPALPFERY